MGHTALKCPGCASIVLSHVERCHVCGADVGFPNVRAAESIIEQNALAERLRNAKVSADARSCLRCLEDFGLAVSKSDAVLARSVRDLDSFVKSENLLYIGFHSQVRAQSRIPEENGWDQGRGAADGTIHPNYYEHINYAALSIDGFGVLWWGDYSIVLKQSHIVCRTTVFEENPFTFCERYRITAGRLPPPGFRGTWGARHELAMAKLVGKIEPTLATDKYASILLSRGTSKADADFVECHIYGPLHRSSIERVIGPRPRDRADLVIWKSVVNTLQRLGATVEEV
jgi:hypothetical protein